ncbi:MAG: ATP synthase F1 subunit gamma [Bacteroidales bacterium]|nr:ATP synthase F1 subunit gamma [Bacteroidales bacterium]
MANLKEIRLRITSVKSTQQVTSAMKMVSAAKLRKAQDAILQMRPYAQKLQEILAQVSQNIDPGANKKYAARDQVKRILLIPITSNRGLCGGFNANVVKRTTELVNGVYAEYYSKGALDILAIGKKANDGLRVRGIKVKQSNNEILDTPTFAEVSILAESVMEAYASGTYDKVVIIYNQFRNAAVQILQEEQLLPAVIEKKVVASVETKGYALDYYYEPSVEGIVSVVIPKSLKIQFFKAILDSLASEHGARMTAMHKATDNAGDLIKQLNLTYNKARQAAITNEILEIVGGANALNG